MLKIVTKTTGLGKRLERDLAKFEQDVKEKVARSGAHAMATVLYDEVKLSTSGSRGNPYPFTGNLHESIYKVFAEDRSDANTKTYQIGWNKKKAPHGHLIEYGTATNPAYPFLRPAFDQMPRAIQAGKDRMRERIKEITGGLG